MIMSSSSSSAAASSSGMLYVRDSRTGLSYEIPIENNAVHAVDFVQVKGCRGLDGTGSAHGLRLVDDGFRNTAVRKSAITFLDADKGRLYYRGHSIEDLVGKKTFEDVCYCLIWGHMPDPHQRTVFRRRLAAAATRPPRHVFDAIQAFPRDAPAMAMVLAGLSAMLGAHPTTIPAFVGRDIYGKDMPAVDLAIVRTLAAFQVVLAVVYCHRKGHAYTDADPDAGFISNLLRMMGFVDGDGRRPQAKHVAYLERLYTIYADHEMSSATAAFLLAASTRADPLSCLVSAFATVSGPIHGGAIDVAYTMLKRVGTPDRVPQLIADVKARKTLLYGYGHRIYKARDPRAKLFRDVLQDVCAEAPDPILDVALEVERIAGEDHFFTSKRVHTNGDLYACFAYTSLGFPQEMVFPMMALGRTQGWLAHWREFMADSPRIWRPKQIYLGDLVPERSKL